MGRDGSLYNISACDVPNETNKCVVNTEIHALDPNARTFVPHTYPIHQNYLLIFITSALMVFTFLIILFLLLIFGDDGKSDMTPKDTLLKIKYDNPNKIIIGHLNINSIRSKIEFLKEIIGNNIDILLISETNLNGSFPICQFLIDGYQVPIRVDRNDHGGGLLLYFQDHIPCKKVTINFDPAIEAIAIEINLKKRKWILIGSYNPHKEMIKNHLKNMGSLLDDLCLKYENVIIIGDLNSEMHEDPMNIFCTTYNLKNLVKEPTCYKILNLPAVSILF